MRRRFMTSAPNKVVIDDIIKCSYRVTMDQYEEYGGALILGTEFDLSQVEWIAVYKNGELFREFESASVIDMSAGDWDDVRIKVNNLTECTNMFCETGLKSADFSTVDTGNITNCASMFERTLITVSPFDVLPIKNLSSFCCRNMFSHCEALAIAPSLPATKLATGCYEGMFFGCVKLCYIKMLATDISAVGCLGSWVYDVASTGTFVKSKDATWDVVGDSGVPTGWTVITDEEESERGDNNLISFTIYVDSYQAEEGMTWGEWCNSEYNTNGYYIDDYDLISNQSGSAWVGTSEYYVFSQDIIIEGYEYVLVM